MDPARVLQGVLRGRSHQYAFPAVVLPVHRAERRARRRLLQLQRRPHATVSLAIEAPPGVAFSAADPPPGWKLHVETTRAEWTGGRIEGTRTVAFPIRVLARTRAGNETFRAAQRYDDGEEVRWPATLSVLPAEGDKAPNQHLGRALAAGAAGVLVLGVSLVVLRLLRRPKLQER